MSCRLSLCGLALVLTGIAGCGTPAPKEQRDPGFKVTGRLLINGKPEESILVSLVRTSPPDPSATTSKTITPGAQTNSDGNFSIGTYELGDGAPNGDYVMTIQWGA